MLNCTYLFLLQYPIPQRCSRNLCDFELNHMFNHAENLFSSWNHGFLVFLLMRQTLYIMQQVFRQLQEPSLTYLNRHMLQQFLHLYLVRYPVHRVS
jgi:hypothetical protein